MAAEGGHRALRAQVRFSFGSPGFVRIPAGLGFVWFCARPSWSWADVLPSIRGASAEPLPDQVMMQHARAGPTQKSDSPSQKCVTVRHGPLPIPFRPRVQGLVCSITTWNSSGFLRLLGLFGLPIDIALLRREWIA